MYQREGLAHAVPPTNTNFRLTFLLAQLEDLILVHAVQLNPTIKLQISGRMASIGISDVVTASVYSEKTRMKKLMMKMIIIIIIIMNKSQESTVFGGRQNLTSAMKQRPEK